MAVAETFHPEVTERSATFGFAVIALIFVFVLSVQLNRSMVIDIYNLSGTRVDLLGYAFCQVVGFCLAIYGLQKGHIRVTVVYICLVLIFYLTLVLVITAPGKSYIAFLVSRYGILNWLLIGLGAAGAISILQSMRLSKSIRFVRILYLISASICAALSITFALAYMAVPLWTISYQSVANNAMMMMIVNLVVIEALWGKDKPTFLMLGFIATSAMLAVAISIAGSTGIIAFWVAVNTALTLEIIRRARFDRKILMAALCILFGLYFTTTESFREFTESSRFAVFFGGEGSFSSVQSRLSILDSFGEQFVVSPIFGHFSAEIVSGAGAGNFVHSLPLAFLTHSGVVGFSLMCICLGFVLGGRLVQQGLDTAEKQYAIYMLVVLLLGTLATFLTWSVFWFMLGLLCKRTNLAQ